MPRTTHAVMQRQSVLSAVLYGAVAVAANFINKSAMLMMPFAPNTVLAVQLMAMYSTAHALNASGVVSFPAFSMPRYWQLLPLSLAYAAHATLVLRSLLYLNVAIYNTLKRLTPVLVLLFKALYERRLPGRQETACVMLIVSGCIVAGAGDLAYSATGYATAFVCAALQAVYILLAEANDRKQASAKQKGLMDSHTFAQLAGGAPAAAAAAAAAKPQVNGVSDLPALANINNSNHTLQQPHSPGGGSIAAASNSTTHDAPSQPHALLATLSSSVEVLYYTSLSALPLVATAAVLTRELDLIPLEAPMLYQRLGGLHGLVPWAVSVAWAETALAGTLVWCTECNSGLTTSIVGVLKGVVAVVLGLFFMAGGARVTALNLLGVGMVLAGGCWYSSLQCFRKR